MSKVPTVQIAFQGGGAKLIAMLPVAAAFKKCHDDGTIKISAVSGASAGSICAALIASEADFTEVVKNLRQNGAAAIARIVSEEAKRLSDMMNEGIWVKTKFVMTNFRFLLRIIFGGHPILDEKHFSNFIKSIFESSRIHKVENTKIKLFINASDIIQQENRYLSKGYIHTAVIDSASIPFAFRSFRALSRSHVVDGGLCQNLPTDILRQTNDKDPIFAVFPDFAEEKAEIGNILEYCFALFGASITHNVERSRAEISKAFSIGVPCKYSTFDFEKALQQIQDDNWFRTAVADYEAQIRDFAHNYGTLDSDRHFRVSDIDSKDEYIQVIDDLTQNYDEYFEYLSSRFHVFVNCDRYILENDFLYRRPADTVVKTAQFKIKKEGFKYYKTGLAMDAQTGVPRPAIWTARNLTTGEDLDITVLALKKRDAGGGVRHGCIVTFTDAGTKISVGDEIELVDSSYSLNGMTDMNRRRNDYISMWNPHRIPIKRAELVITYPKKIGKYRMINASRENSIDDELVRQLAFTSSELGRLPPELATIGIYTEELEPRSRFQGLAVMDRYD
ncbi:patatin-like phospholipase family protein [Rhizobium leguminosarum]|uniref:patatin-like phospholipase family protein n=1 Tax=Rhizobium leguminosarum TaxID=384 RepID=UPI003F9DF8B5